MSLSSILCSYKYGCTALYWAVFNGHLEVATFLVNAGASIDIPDIVSTRIRLCIQTITINKYYILIYILYIYINAYIFIYVNMCIYINIHSIFTVVLVVVEVVLLLVLSLICDN